MRLSELVTFLYKHFPREFATPKRRLVMNVKDFFNLINLHNGKTNVYTSLYGFRVLKHDDERKPIKPMYESAIVDKVFFDLDQIDAYSSTLRLHEFLVEKDIKHLIAYSGGGFHIYVFAKVEHLTNQKDSLKGFSYWLADNTRVVISENQGIDPHPIGDVARIVRVIGTYNIKQRRYCIPLTQEQLMQGEQFIVKLADGIPLEGDWIIGSQEVELSKFASQEKPNFSYTFPEVEVSQLPDLPINLNLPPCISRLLQIKDLRWRQRYVLILFLRELGLDYKHTLKILYTHLSPRKFKHCVFEEKQLQHLYRRDDLQFPSCEVLRREGFAVPDCPCVKNVGFDLRKHLYL